MTTRSSCRHTVRGVLACAFAGAGLDEPFDCRPDALAVSQLIYERGQDLNRRLPGRLNIGFGGCASCRDHARTNDLGFVSLMGGRSVTGYQVWLGGDLGAGRIGRVVGRITEDELHSRPARSSASGKRCAGTVSGSATRWRVGDDAVSAYLHAVLAARWEPGPEPDGTAGISGAHEVVGAS